VSDVKGAVMFLADPFKQDGDGRRQLRTALVHVMIAFLKGLAKKAYLSRCASLTQLKLLTSFLRFPPRPLKH